MNVQISPSSPASALAGQVAANNDAVTIALPGGDWATAKVSFDGVFNGTLQQEYSDDGGFNWKTAPYARRLDAVAANPSVTATIVSAAVASSWEVPVPGNCTHFRVRQTAGTVAGKVTVAPLTMYNPGDPVVAVLYDLTSGSNAALDTGTVDTAGWTSVQHDFTMSGGTPAFSMQEVDDGGTSLANIVTSAAAFMGGLGAGTVVGGTAGIVAATAQVPLPKRTRYQSAAIVAQTSRIRLVARR